LKIGDYELFKSILRLDQKSLKSSLEATLKAFYKQDKIVNKDGYLMFIGDSNIGLLAHMDTVHKMMPREIFWDKEQNVIWSPEGLGGDDRCGIYAIMKIVAAGFRPTILFLEDEETGGRGATKLVMDYPSPPKKLNCLIELDRMDKNDAVFYDCDNVKFEKYIESFGFMGNWGTFSDISIVAPAWHIAAVNLSIGYMDEHTKSERVYVDDMEGTIEKVKLILQDGCKKHYKYIRGKIPGIARYYYGYDDPLYGDMTGAGGRCYSVGVAQDEGVCFDCLNIFKETELIPITDPDGYTDYVCADCYLKRVMPQQQVVKIAAASQTKKTEGK